MRTYKDGIDAERREKLILGVAVGVTATYEYFGPERRRIAAELGEFGKTIVLSNRMFSGQAPWRVGEIEKPPACMQKPRSKNWPNGRCARGKPELATGNGDCSRKPKAFRSEMAARWILEAIDCEVCQAVRNYTRGRANNASRRWPRRSDC